MLKVETEFTEPSLRVKALREQILAAVPRIEAERAVIITESYKETEGLPTVIRRAKALERMLHKLPVIIRDHELIVGSLTTEPRSAQVYPEFSNAWLREEFDRIGNRDGDAFQISEEVKNRLNDVFDYWQGKTTSELATSYMEEETKACMAANVFTVGNYYMNGVGHIAVDYGKILAKGYRGVIAETVEAMTNADKHAPEYIKQQQFYKAVIISCTAAIHFAKRYAEKARELLQYTTDNQRKAELQKIAVVCERVPEHGATTFHEACQAFWFIHAIINIESNGHSVSPGRFDQYMYPYYQADSSVTREEAQEMIDCIWVKLNDLNKVRDEVSTKAFGGYPMFQNLIVGGQTADGIDATNELSFLAMQATAHVRLSQPSFSVRVWSKSPDEFLIKACELARLGLGVPAFYNDEVIVPALTNRGLTLGDARSYAVIGCVEPQCPGKTEGWHDSAFFNLPKVLEVTMNNGRCADKQLGPETGEFENFSSMEAVIAAYRQQMEYFVYHLIAADNAVDYAHAERAPLPFLSCMVSDCLAEGKSLQEGGAHYNFSGPQGVGAANVGDSFMAMKKTVFDDKVLTLKELKAAIDSNFYSDGSIGAASATSEETYDLVLAAVKKVLGDNASIDIGSIADKLHLNNGKAFGQQTAADPAGIREMLQSVDKFGNDIDEVDYLTREGAAIYCREVEKYSNPRGGTFQAGLYPASINVLMGSHVGATPDGRAAFEPLSDGVSPSRGTDSSGPTAATNSVAKLDHFIASNGTLYNQKFHPSAVSGDAGLRNLASLVRGYFDHKGMHIQFNVIDRNTLIAAQKQPEKYRDLVVRVAGYSAQFISLDKGVQDDIIMRTEHVF
ncbi:formate C-acetyltransferase [Evansella caseinilytica]|uniref:Formate C-acetyltransferase n=1 Tax=Evansella caseinilytica TaxID=1503961 RepID=A0A1H3HW18_9BACI|nr:glycyl radical protein [Evansella caseinilytica]SDY19640.1 formate C-acetyltransferase [Evansella caseinilytica]